MGIFATHAPAYHAAGLSAIPLYSAEKRPAIGGWQRFADIKVDEATSLEWVETFPNGNIGLALGKSSNLVMVDIDTEDPKIYDAIMKVLPPSPWHRLGKKGMMLAYKWTPAMKTCRIKNLSGETIVEILSSRTQCVLPPSIHPDTREAYKSNTHLIDVLNEMVTLPDDLESKLRQTIAGCGVNLSLSGSTRLTEYVSSGSRDTSLTEMAGLFSYAIVRGERTLKEAIGMLRSYHEEFIENTSGDIVPCQKHIDNLIRFLHRDVLDKGKILPIGWDAGFSEEELKGLGITITEDNIEWDFETIIDFLQHEFQTHEGEKQRSDAVEKGLKKIAMSRQLTRLEIERILKYISEVSRLKLNVSALRNRLKDLKAGNIAGQDHSEIARAVISDLEHLGLFRFYGEKFMKWNGSHWENYPSNSIKIHISSQYGHLAACRKSADINGIVNIVSYLLPTEIKVEDIRGVNFANGFLTQELKLVPHNPDFGMTYTLPFRYMPGEAGRFPQFSEFMDRCWGHDADFDDKLKALQEAMCVTLFGLGPKFQKAILLHGAPASGKTQLLRIIESIVPDDARTAVPPEQWDDKFLPAQLHNKILNLCGELAERSYINGQRFKDIIDGTEMSGQHKNQQIFQFRPMVTHWFASNHMPRSKDTSRGFIRRWLMLTFTRPVSASEKKLDIGLQIAGEEREAIVAWAAQAMPRLLAQSDYTSPKSHEDLVQEFANVNNSVRFYLKESGKVQIEEGLSATELNLYNSYWSFCLGGGGVQPVGSTTFRAMLRELGTEFGFALKLDQGRFGNPTARYEGLAIRAG